MLDALGKHSLAEEALRKAVSLCPRDGYLRYLLAPVLWEREKLNEAIQQLRTAIRLMPRLWQAHFVLGDMFTQLGRQEEAVRAHEQARRLKPRDVPWPK